MKPIFIALSLFVATAIGIALFPSWQSAQATVDHLPVPVSVPQPSEQHAGIEVVFVLDTTSSMSGLIEAAKEKIWSIATTLASSQQKTNIKMGLVAFRDRGDRYVTKVFNLSNDLDSIYASLMDFRAEGGGDGPESLNQALADSINRISWSDDNSVYKVVFLIGDAPPHMDYKNDIKYPVSLALAAQKGILVNTIQSGQGRYTGQVLAEIAELGQGSFLQVEESGNAVAVVTPFDKKLAALSSQLEQTRLYFGNADDKETRQRKQNTERKLHRQMSDAALARRATYNASPSGRLNLLGKNELVDKITSGELTLDQIKPSQLPKSLSSLEPDQQLLVIKQKAQKRDEIKREIDRLSASRQQFIKERIDADGSAAESLDEKIYATVKKQAKSKGLDYEQEEANY